MKTKNKLMAAVAMLVISTLMLTTASYAWFSISTAPEVKIKATAVANQNLEIALSNGQVPAVSDVGDGADDKEGKNMTWGNLVDLSNLSEEVQATLTLKPVGFSDAGALQYPKYAADGRISELANLNASYLDNGIKVYKIAEAGEVWAIQLDLWLRTNINGAAITLSTAANRIAGDDTTLGGGSTLLDGEGNALTTDAIQVKIWVGTALGADTAAGATDSRTVAFTDAASVTATVGEGGALTTTDPIIASATANAIYPVSVLLYMDGESVTNADVAEAIDVALNLQFASTTVTTPMPRD